MERQIKSEQVEIECEQKSESYMLKQNVDSFKYKREFEIVYNVIFKAYEAIKSKNFTINEKDDKTFVTESDLLVEQIIMNEIKNNFPKDNFVTEETNYNNEIKDRTWVIDPIDGTAHYIKNSIFWGIQIAFIDENNTKFSIIYLPKLNEIYYALENKGVYLNHEKITISKNIELKKSIVEFCGSLYKCYEDKVNVFHKLINYDDQVANFMHINSCCFAFANLISGRTDTLVLSTKKPWDVLPGKFLCKEAGLESINFGELEIFSKSSELIKRIND